jgi:ankyrin repeat protein
MASYTYFTCPLSKKIFLNPVIIADGYFYEKNEIEKWLCDNDTSPVTGEKLSHLNIIPCHTFKEFINNVLDATVELSLELGSKMKRDQYVESNSHADNKFIIRKIIDKGLYEKLLNYTQFSITLDNSIITLLEKCEDIDVIKHLIDNTIDLYRYRKAIPYIMEMSSDLILYALQKEKINVKMINPVYVCYHNNLEVLKLVANDNIINITDPAPPLLAAIFNENKLESYKIVQYLLEHNFDLNAKFGFAGDSYIHKIATHSTVEIMKLFVQKKVDPNGINLYGDQIIHYAVYNNLDMVKYVIGLGLNINASNYYGCRPIDFACSKGKYDVINFLLTRGVELNYDKRTVYLRNKKLGLINEIPNIILANYGNTLIEKVKMNPLLTKIEKNRIVRRLESLKN